MQKEGYVLKKENFLIFINSLKKFAKVIAPVKDQDIVRFSKITNGTQITLDGISWFPPKRFQFPSYQTLFKYKEDKITENRPSIKKTILFGLKLCDSNALVLNDHLFLNRDENYKLKRENTYLIATYCFNQIDKYCFCSSMELKDYYDLLIIERPTHFHIKTASKKGEELIKKTKLKTKEDYLPPKTKCSLKLKTKQIKDCKEHPLWEKAGSDLCVSCQHCTNLCPSCLCFTIQDHQNSDLKSGERYIEWDSCHNKEFTEVAGGHIFRESRLNRFLHRIYHKIVYFKESFGEYMCTGCGRCIRGCENKINWVRIINLIKK